MREERKGGVNFHDWPGSERASILPAGATRTRRRSINGKGNLERADHCGERSMRNGGRQPLFPAGGGETGVSAAERDTHHVRLEGNCLLPQRVCRRADQPGRGVVLPRSEAGGEKHRRVHCVLERREDRELTAETVRYRFLR